MTGLQQGESGQFLGPCFHGLRALFPDRKKHSIPRISVCYHVPVSYRVLFAIFFIFASPFNIQA